LHGAHSLTDLQFVWILAAPVIRQCFICENQFQTMPYIVEIQVGMQLPFPRIPPSSLQFEPFFAQLRHSDLRLHTDVSQNPLFLESVARIRLFHELSLDHDMCIHQEAKLAALAERAPQNSVSQLLLDMMSLWGKKMIKIKSLCEIMEKCTREMSAKITLPPTNANNPRSAETPYTLEQKQKSLEETMKRKLGGELLSIQVQIAEKRRRMNFSNEAVKTLKQWFSSHSSKPYPTEEEKEQLAYQTGITVHQVTNWFINMRKRNWDPAF
jgi:hypothetical protein